MIELKATSICFQFSFNFNWGTEQIPLLYSSVIRFRLKFAYTQIYRAHTKAPNESPRGTLTHSPIVIIRFYCSQELKQNKYLETKERSTASWPHPGQHPLPNTQAPLLTSHSLSALLSLRLSFPFLVCLGKFMALRLVRRLCLSATAHIFHAKLFFFEHFSCNAKLNYPATPPPAPFSRPLWYGVYFGLVCLGCQVSQSKNFGTLI